MVFAVVFAGFKAVEKPQRAFFPRGGKTCRYFDASVFKIVRFGRRAVYLAL